MKLQDYFFESNQYESVIIYGATVGGKLIYYCLKKRGIDVLFFCDRSKAGSVFCGKRVVSPEILMEQRDKIVILAVTRSLTSVLQYLINMDLKKIFSCKRLIESEPITAFEWDKDEKILAEDFVRKYPIYVDGVNTEKLLLASLEVFITECCTLRCRDCSHLIPRYIKKGAKNHDINTIILQLENVLQVVDYIEDLIILGGEPLLHNELDKFLLWGYKCNKVGRMTIITNGTVMPKDNLINTITQTGTRVRISDYGNYSIKLDDITRECEKAGISYYVNREMWTDMGEIFNHEYKRDELIRVFEDCPFAYALLLLKGKLFRCAHVAHLNNLGIINSWRHDCVDFTVAMKDDEECVEKRKELLDYMKIDYLEGCSYCNGIKNSIQGIEPAIQGER